MLVDYLAKAEGIALLDVNPGLVLWTFIIFGIVLLLLHRFAWAPIAAALDVRANKIHGDIERAEKLKNEAEEKLGGYLKKLDSLKEEGSHMLAESRKQAERQKEEILSTAKKEADTLIERGKKEVLHAKDQALAEVHEQIVSFAIAVAGQILERELKPEDHKKLTLQAIEKLQSQS